MTQMDLRRPANLRRPGVPPYLRQCQSSALNPLSETSRMRRGDALDAWLVENLSADSDGAATTAGDDEAADSELQPSPRRPVCPLLSPDESSSVQSGGPVHSHWSEEPGDRSDRDGNDPWGGH